MVWFSGWISIDSAWSVLKCCLLKPGNWVLATVTCMCHHDLHISGLKKSHVLIFSKCKYLQVKIASLCTVKSSVTIGPNDWWQMFGPVHIPYISSRPYHLHSRYFNDNCFKLWCQTSVRPLRLVKECYNIGHARALLWLFIHSFIHSFVNYYRFFLSTWGRNFTA